MKTVDFIFVCAIEVQSIVFISSSFLMFKNETPLKIQANKLVVLELTRL